MKRELRALVLVTLLVGVLFVPIASATHISFGAPIATGTWGCPTPVATFTLTAGTRYQVLAGASADAGIETVFQLRYSGNDTNFLVFDTLGRVNPAAYFTAFGFPQPQASIDGAIIRHVNVSDGKWYATVEFTAPVGVSTVEYSCNRTENEAACTGCQQWSDWNLTSATIDAYVATVACGTPCHASNPTIAGYVATATPVPVPATPALVGSMADAVASLTWSVNDSDLRGKWNDTIGTHDITPATGATTGTGNVGKAMLIGSNAASVGNIGDASDMRPTCGWSSGAWVRFDSGSSGVYRTIISKGATIGTLAYTLYVIPGDAYYMSQDNVDASISGVATPENVWVHVVGTHSCSGSGQMVLYLNGTARGWNNATGTIPYNERDHDVGYSGFAEVSPPARFCRCAIDNLTLYNGTWTPAQVASLYVGSAGVPMTAQYRFEDYGIVGWRLNRTGPDGALVVRDLSRSPFSYRDVLAGYGAWRYNVSGILDGSGFTSTSNDVTLNATRGTTLFADDGPLFGGSVESQAGALFGTTSTTGKSATRFFFGLLLLVGIAGSLAIVVSPAAGGVAAVGVVVLLAVVGWWSAWVVAFAGVILVVGLLVVARGRSA